MHALVLQVSIEALRQLDEYLFETYIEKKSDPIVGSLEPGIYAGYFDWKDCLPPTGNTHLNHVTCMLTTLCERYKKTWPVWNTITMEMVLIEKVPQTLLLVLILQFQSAIIAFISVSVMVVCVCVCLVWLAVGTYLTKCYWLCESFVNKLQTLFLLLRLYKKNLLNCVKPTQYTSPLLWFSSQSIWKIIIFSSKIDKKNV